MKLGRVVDPKHCVANTRIFEYIGIFSATISTWLCAALGFERIGSVVILTSRLNSNISTFEQLFTIYGVIHLLNLFLHMEIGI